MAAPAPLGREHVRRAIVRYLQSRPLAKDALPGVVQWCRMELGTSPSAPLVEAVLEQLVAEGVVKVHLLPDGNRVFSAERIP